MTRRASALALGLLLAPAPAPAQEPGVHVDPSSPAGKEYAIPLEDAQRPSARHPRGEGGAPAERPLFGNGVRRSTGRVPAPAPASPRSRTARQAAAADQDAGSYLSTVRADDGPPTPLIAGGSVAAVLLLGGGLLVLMRRGARRP
jgi:hypothetical protein